MKKLSPEEKRRNASALERSIIIALLAVLYFTALCLVFLKRPTESEVEKRKLAERPALTQEAWFSGTFAKEFDKWFSDTVPYREQIVTMVSAINKRKGIAAPTFYGNVQMVATTETSPVTTPAVTDASAPVTNETMGVTGTDLPESDMPGGETMPAVTETPEETVTEVTTTEELVENIAEFSNNGIIVDGVKMYGDNAGVMLFGGNDPAGTRYAQVISRYKELLGDDINVYNMVVPTSVEFYLPHKFSLYSVSEKDAIQHIYDSYTADVIPIDAYSEIAEHTDEYIYLRTDHHWSQRGAYYAYKAFCKALGMDCPDIDKDYEVKTKTGFVGSLYGYTNDATLKNSPEIFTYYMPKSEYHTYYYKYRDLSSAGESVLFHEYAEGVNCYGMFLGTDQIHTKITTGLDTGRKICVFKESYGNAFVPFLVDNFDEIYVIDIRYFGTNAVRYIREKGITDVLFIDNIFAVNTDKLINDIAALSDRTYGSEGGAVIDWDTIATAVTDERGYPVTRAVTGADGSAVTDTAGVVMTEMIPETAPPETAPVTEVGG
ncbi:MAG: hypothetical protein IKR73_01290 [Oscillospiraceae bacterium]|nr:hypothetical protein [Oscillospiraceae bacterium]